MAAVFISLTAFCGIRQYRTASPTFLRPELGRLPPQLFLFIDYSCLIHAFMSSILVEICHSR
nr:MAG TPA: hypothetical protein [Caudoviricetes sp.]